jgi:putative ABC transport system permease protein
MGRPNTVMDFHLAIRRLAARPGYTALLVLIVGVGVGAATTVFSVVDQLLLRPAPFAFADRLVDVLDTNRVTRGGGNNLTPEKIAGWQAQPALFERFEAAAPLQFDVTGDAEPERISGLNVSIGLFSMLGVEPRLGRGFMAGDGRPGGPPVAIISEDIWRRRFGGQPDALGRALTLNDQDYTVVGVMPRRFRLIQDKESVWLPVDIGANRGDRTMRSFYGLARLAPGVRLPAAQQMADSIADRLQAASPIARTWDLRLDRKQVASVDPTTRTALFVLLGAVTFVLFITCANVANLFLSHAPLRLREMAICAALGSGRARLIRGVLAESLLLAAAGGALGVVLANWGVAAMLAAAPAGLSFRATSPVEVDGRIVAVAIAMTLVTGLVIGLLPALRGSKPNIESTLRASSSSARSSFGRVPAALVVFEVAFSIVLLVGAALMARTMANLQAIDPGFEPSGLIALHVDLPTDRYRSLQARGAFFDELFQRLRGVPGVTGMALATGLPPGQGGFSWGALEGEGSSVAPARAIVPINRVSPEYFGTLRIPLRAGRAFEAGDGDDVAIVSQGLADRLWPGATAVGKRFRIAGARDAWSTVVGVVGNVESRAAGEERTVLQIYDPLTVPRGAAAAAPPPAGRRTYASRLLVVRAQDPSAAIADIKRQVWAIDPAQSVQRVALVTDTYAEAFGRQRFVLLLMSIFSFIAVALTAAGIFGVLSQIVMRRTREIGIRMALGARPSDVLGQVLSRGLALTLAGAVIGLGAAVGLTRVLGSLLFGVSPTDPLSFATVGVFLVAVALLSCWLPARAAMRIEPASALRVD